MRRKSLSLLLGIVAMLLPTIAGAYDFETGGLYYDVVSFTEFNCVVVPSPDDNPYSGDIVVPDVVTYNNRDLKVVGIAEYAFRNRSIDSVLIGDNVMVIGVNAFSQSTVKKVTFGKGVIILGEHAFSECQNIVSVKLPEKLTIIPYGLFDGCKNLKEVIFPAGLETIESYAFSRSGIEEIALPATVTRLDGNTFSECAELRSLTLPTYIEVIPGYMCSYCYKLTSIILPPSVKEIKSFAFWKCSSLATVDLGRNLKTIESDVFYGCDRINIINSYAPIAPESASTFESNVYTNSTLYVPNGAKASYAASPNWKEFKNIEDQLPDDSITGAVPTVVAPAVKVTAEGNVVTISGVSDDSTVRIYTIDGRNIVNTTDKTIQLRKGNVYVIFVEGQAYKVLL